jgi:NitT/TauT family transport system ATP-binding protein
MITQSPPDRLNQQSGIEIKGLVKEYNQRGKAFRALSIDCLSIGSGEFVAVVGPSGCGKSTLLSIVAGLSRATAGAVTVGGRLVVSPVTDIGIVFQKDLLLEWRSAIDNVLMQAEARGIRREPWRDAARELLSLVGLRGFEDYLPGQLSGGMRQRVALCRALLLDPPIVLMDEPFAALDALTRDQIALDFSELWQKKPKTVLFITHSIPEAIFLADRVVVMTPQPGGLDLDLSIDLPRPRTLDIRETPEFMRYAARIRERFEAFGVLRTRYASRSL